MHTSLLRTIGHTVGLAVFAGTLASCGLFDPDEAKPCRDTILLEPAANDQDVLTIRANEATPVAATIRLCKGKVDPADGWTMQWYYDTDGDGELSDAELATPVAQTPEYTLIACYTDVGDHPLRIIAAPTPKADGSEPRAPIERNVTVRVAEASGTVERPTCYQPSLDAIRTAGAVNASTIAPIQEAADCLDAYLETNLCDFQASYAVGLARFSEFMARLPGRFEDRNNMTVVDVEDLYQNEVLPIISRFLVVAQKAPRDFVFTVDGTFNLRAFEDLPYLPGSEETNILLGGTHDMGEVYGIAAAAAGIRGGVEMALAYHGIAQFGLDIPRLDQVDFRWFRLKGIERMIEDPTFLMIDEDSVPNGYERLLYARGAFMDAIGYLQQAVRHVRQETNAQKDHLLRYWDCGSDGICNCNDTSEIYLGICPNSAGAWQGPDEDGTEGNGRYDKGEPVGTNRFGFPEFGTIDLPSDLDEFLRQTTMLRDNLRGPDALDLDKLAGGLPVRTALQTIDMPYPEIRSSQWFLDPAHPRHVVPLYSISAKDVIFATEGEPYDDLGYDGLANKDEKIVHDPNPLGLALGTPWDSITNPDPHFDDLDPICNPVCNANDGIDNDADGLADNDDRFVLNEGNFDVTLDLGVEGNLVFDFVDINDNFRHDAGEPSEVFRDTGVLDYRGQTVGAGNGRWDFADRAFDWPTGGDIGPFGDLDRTDPTNGTSRDAQVRALISDLAGTSSLTPAQLATLGYAGLYDPFYFFYPDATFSGVLVFPDDVVGIDGGTLTDNAKFQRFINKALELAAIVRIGVRPGDGRPAAPREGFGHPCADEAACRAAVDLLKGN